MAEEVKKAHAIPARAPNEIKSLLMFGVTGLTGSTELLDTRQGSIHVFLGNRCLRAGIGPDLVWTATILHHDETGFVD